MSKILDELLSSSEVSNEPRGFVFFTEDGVEGYTSRDKFLTSLRNQKKGAKSFRITHIKTLFDNMAANRKLLSEPTLSKEDGENVIWVRFVYGNTRQNLQILHDCNMLQFIKDYATGKIKNVPTFEELINSISQE